MVQNSHALGNHSLFARKCRLAPIPKKDCNKELMDPRAQLKVAHDSVKKANFYIRKGKYGRAFSHLLITLKLAPFWKSELKEVFSSTLHTWGDSLERSERYNDLFNCYEQALEVFPKHEVLLSNLGELLYRLGHLREACCYFRQACIANSNYMPAIWNLHNCCNLAVERWHYRMLNDSRRNEAYRSAILHALQQGEDRTVLDIGCGTGILSLFAVEGGASMVYACDGSDNMIHIATQVMESNDSSSKVKLINKLSQDLKIPNDIPCRVSMVVTEIFDAGLFGEHVLQTVLHAWENLLAPNGEVVPHGAILWASVIECPYLAARQYVSKSTRSVLKCPAPVVWKHSEPYGCEDLSSLPGGFRYLTEPVIVCTVNFNDPENVRHLLQGDLDHSVEVLCTQTGVAHAVVTWFALRLGDSQLTTCPGAEQRAECWDQAVFPLPQPHMLSSGQQLVFNVCCAEGRLCVGMDSASVGATGGDDYVEPLQLYEDVTFKCKQETDMVPSGLEILQLSPSSEADLKPSDFPGTSRSSAQLVDTQILTILSQEVVCFLNDQQLVRGFCQVVETICLNRKVDDVSSCLNVLDLCPFPLVGVLLASRLQGVNVSYVARTVHCESVLESVVAANGISGEQMKCLTESDLSTVLLSGAQFFDVIIVHLLDPSGKLNEVAFAQLPLIRNCLKKDGLLIPRRLTLHGELVCCDWLDRMSRAISDNLTCGKKISEFINMYAVPEHRDFHLSTVHHVVYSNPVELLHVELETARSKLGTTAYIPLNCTGFVTALPYWYSLTLLEGLRVSTLRDDSTVGQAAIIIHPHIKVEQGRSVQVRTVLDSGHLNITVCHCEPGDEV